MRKRTVKISELAMPTGTRINTTRISRVSKKMFATGDNHNNIVIWLIDDGESVMTLSSSASQNSEISALCFSNNENDLISGSSRGIINIWDINTAKGHSTSVVSFTTFPMNDYKLASGSYDTNIKLWDIRSKDNTTTLKHHTKQVTSMDASPDARMLLSGSEDGTIKIWDLRYPEKLIFTYIDHTGPVNVVKFHPEDVTFASGSSDKTAKYFRCQPNHYNLLSSTQAGTASVTAIEFSEDGRILYTATNDSLKLWNMGRHGLLLDSVESPWKGVQDLCMIDGTLTGVAWGTSGLSVWVYYSKSIKDKRQKIQEQQILMQPSSHQNKDRREEILHVKDQLNLIQEKMIQVEALRLKRIDLKSDNVRQPMKDPNDLDNKPQSENKKKNLLEELERKREEEAQKKIEQQKRVAQQEKKNRAEAQKKKEGQRQKAEEDRIRRESEKARKLRQKKEQEAQRAQEDRAHRQLKIQNLNQNMGEQHQQQIFDSKRLLDSILEQERLQQSLNISTFMGDKEQRDKFKQYDMISDILKGSAKFTSIINTRKNKLTPILTQLSENNIGNVLQALEQQIIIQSRSDVFIVVDATQAIISTPKYKAAITPDVAILLVCKSAELMLNKQYRFIRNGIFYINQIALMYKDELIKLKAFSPINRVDLSREKRIAKYDRLLDEFLNVFRMERLKKLSKEDQSQQLNQLASVLYKNLDEILTKCLPKN